MTGHPCRLLIVALALSVLPVAAHAQAPSASAQTAAKNGSRTTSTVLGAAIGAGAGLVIGEFWFGKALDLPHGPDMLIGAGIFGAAGALIGWALGGSEPATAITLSKGFSVAPVLSKSRKAVVFRLSFR
jgi:hypothetical protein